MEHDALRTGDIHLKDLSCRSTSSALVHSLARLPRYFPAIPLSFRNAYCSSAVQCLAAAASKSLDASLGWPEPLGEDAEGHGPRWRSVGRVRSIPCRHCHQRFSLSGSTTTHTMDIVPSAQDLFLGIGSVPLGKVDDQVLGVHPTRLVQGG